MRKIIISIFALSLIFMPLIVYAQNWTPEEEEILERVRYGWSTWEDAVKNKDYSIHLNAMNRPDDFRCWWTSNSYLWSFEDTKKNFDFMIKDIAEFRCIAIKPVEIQVHDNVAFIWFYAETSVENNKGITSTTEEKRFEVYRKIEGEWIWSAGMVHANPVGNIIE